MSAYFLKFFIVMQKYKFIKFSNNYKNYFRYEKNLLHKTLGNNVAIEHVGSTAVKGLGGKGITDIVIGVNADEIRKSKSMLESAGYEYRAVASVPGRIFFRKDYVRKNRIRRVHIHLVKITGKELRQMIMFRDYLINNPGKLREYSQIKKLAVKAAKGDGKIYRSMKEEFIKNIIAGD